MPPPPSVQTVRPSIVKLNREPDHSDTEDHMMLQSVTSLTQVTDGPSNQKRITMLNDVKHRDAPNSPNKLSNLAVKLHEKSAREMVSEFIESSKAKHNARAARQATIQSTALPTKQVPLYSMASLDPLLNDNHKPEKPELALVDTAIARARRAARRRVKPSEYLREMSMSTQERLAECARHPNVPAIVDLMDIRESSCHRDTDVPVDEPLFKPIPSEVVLQSYSAFEAHDVLLSFRNRDKFVRHFKIEHVATPIFHVQGWKGGPNAGGRVAPGMEIFFLLKFTPESNCDYYSEIVCITDREKFLIPIRALGVRGYLDLPDEVNFSESPVKYRRTRTILARNVGKAPAKFTLHTTEPFSVVPDHGLLEMNSAIQLDVHFFPKKIGDYEGELRVVYDSGEEVYIKLFGVAEDVNVRLEKTSLRMDSTYISLTTCKTFKIVNRSNITANFHWKLFATEVDEEHERYRRSLEIDDEEHAEKLRLREALKLDRDIETNEIALVSKRAQNKKRDLDLDLMPFNDNTFTIEPLSGQIWPESFVEVTVAFTPRIAQLYDLVAYCDVAGRETRLPIQLKGEGLGPKARFPFDWLDIEDVFVNSSHRYTVTLQNKGAIALYYSVIPNSTLFGPKFHFYPDNGVLQVNEEQLIEIEFQPDILGSFSEEFHWALDGSPETMILGFRGRVIGPTFEFNVASIDFGMQSHGFSCQKVVQLENTSEIGMSFNLSIQDSEDNADLQVTPISGSLGPGEKMNISVSLLPKSVRNYETALIVDVIDVGEAIRLLPIVGHSVVPKIMLEQEDIDLGECFLHYAYQTNIHLVNDSSLPANYSLLSQESSNAFTLTSRQSVGVIAPRSTAVVDLEVICNKLGKIQTTVGIVIIGKETEALEVNLAAFSVGPTVHLSVEEINWGKIPVLKRASATFHITNESLIPANYVCEVVHDKNVFQVEPASGRVEPGQVVPIQVHAFLDDHIKFRDVLKVGIQYSNITEVQLIASGFGTTVYCDDSLKKIDFENVFTNRQCSKEFTLVNKGRRSETLTWFLEDVKSQKRIAFGDPKLDNTEVIFGVAPSRFTLPPGGRQIITVNAYSTKSALCREMLVCQSQTDKDPTKRIILGAEVTATFVTPLLKFSSSTLQFMAKHDRESFLGVQTKDVVVQNVSALPLRANLSTQAPFSVSPEHSTMVLLPEEFTTIRVLFDPMHRKRRDSYRETSKLFVTYVDHPQKDNIDLCAEVAFPNLTLDADKIVFGCVQNDTEQRRTFTMRNTSELLVKYSWHFLLDHRNYANGSNSISEIFDIHPLQGSLFPGEEQVVEVLFMGRANGQYQVAAVCDVEAGPKYEVLLSGEASNIVFDFNTRHLDFGSLPYQEVAEQEVVLNNRGKVAFRYEFYTRGDSPIHNKILVSPNTGIIPANTRQRCVIKFCPTVPDHLDGLVHVQIAHFEPETIRICGTGQFPLLHVPLPPFDQNDYDLYSSLVSANFVHTEETDGSKKALLEDEVLRKMLCEKTKKVLDLNLTSMAAIRPPGTMRSTSTLDSDPNTQQVKGSAKANSYSVLVEDLSSVNLLDYLCDFGNVIRNTVRRRVIKATNRSQMPITINVDKMYLGGTGFTVEPERVRNLPPGESVELVVTFQSRGQSIDSGIVEAKVPIHLIGGPTIHVVMKATITQPEIEVTHELLDFGSVQCGQRKSITFQITNTNRVSCDWTASLINVDMLSGVFGGSPNIASMVKRTALVPMTKKAAEAAILEAAKLALGDFQVVPAAGTLHPDEKVSVAVRFAPSSSKSFEFDLPIRVNMNAKHHIIHIKASSFQPVIHFEPNVLELPTVLPFSDGSDSKLTIINPMNYPIEIISLDFDRQHIDELLLLRRIDGYENGIIYIPPRQPGEGLPSEIVEQAMNKIKKETAALGEGLVDGELEQQADLQGELGAGELIPNATDPSQDPNANVIPPVNIVLHGPPLSGKTVQAKRLAKLYSIAYVRIDEFIDSLLNNVSAEFLALTPGLSELATRLQQAVAASAARADENKHEDTNADVLVKGESKEDEDDYHRLTTDLPDEIITEAMITRLQMPDCTKGAIVDGLDSKYSGNALLVFKAIQRGFGEKKKFHVVFLHVSKTVIVDRELQRYQAAMDAEAELLVTLKELSEEDYEKLDDAGKLAYDNSLREHKRKVKEFTERKKIEQTIVEDDTLKQREEDKSKKKDKTRRNAPPANAKGGQQPQGKGKAGPGTTSPKPVRKINEKLAAAAETGSQLEGLSGNTQTGTTTGNASPTRHRGQPGQVAEGDQNLGSKAELDEGNHETAIGDRTLSLYEKYRAAKDELAAFIKEGSEKPKAPVIAPANERDSKRNKGKAGAAHETVVAAQNEDADVHQAEETYVQLVEVDGAQNEEIIFQSMCNNLPPPTCAQIVDTSNTGFSSQTILEQVVQYPSDANVKRLALPKNFALYSAENPPEDDINADSAATPVITAPAAAPAPSKGESKKGKASSKNAASEKAAAAVTIVVDEQKYDEEDPEKENNKYRWILQPQERREFTVRFTSNEIGTFKQKLAFQIIGYADEFVVQCSGQCQYSAIDLDQKKMFSKWRKAKEDKMIMHGEYISNTGTFEFGPLSSNRSREKYQERFPENRAVIKLTGASAGSVKLNFAFRHDARGDVFFFEPSSMDLKQGQSQELHVYAYPRSSGKFDDTFLILIKDNPEPYAIKFSCFGVKPEIELDKKTIQFEKLLLQRTDQREIRLRNTTIMPAAWKIVGSEMLGEEFEITPVEGVIECGQEIVVTAKFKAIKPVVIKRAIRVEIFDLERIGNPVQTENILILAEAYDVSVDVHFPKGFEGGLDFGIIKVFEESKQSFTMKNKGKYEVSFKFLFDGVKDLGEIFAISPAQGLLAPSDKPFSVQIALKANREVFVRENVQLKCQILEPSNNEVIGNIPIKLTAQTVFSKYAILPIRDLSFGSLVFGTKGARQIVIENLGEFDFRFVVSKLVQGENSTDPAVPTGATAARGRPYQRGGTQNPLPGTQNRLKAPVPAVNNAPAQPQRANSPPPTAKPANRKENVKAGDAGVFGPFTVFPVAGSVNQGAKQVLNVEFHPDQQGSFEELISIEISDRAPIENIDGSEYRLFGESCIPGINTWDFTSIFEEHTVRKRLELFRVIGSVYAEDERVFYFGAFNVGQQVQARFKIINPFKVPCDVNISTKPRNKLSKTDVIDFAFDCEPKRLSIPSHEFRFVTVHFHPNAMQTYTGLFEAIVENAAESKGKVLSFELRGDGTLPRVTIEKPVTKTKTGLPLLKFKRCLIGTQQTMTVSLRNEGIIPAKVKLDWTGLETTEFECDAINLYHTIRPQEIKSLQVTCKPMAIKKIETEMRLKVVDNSFEDTVIQVQGEGYMEDVSFEELPNDAEGEIIFDDCFVNELRQVSFVMRNNSSSYLKFAWKTPAEYNFSPSLGHIRPNSSKVIVASFSSSIPVSLTQQKATCRVNRIRINATANDLDWDDKAKTVRWVANDDERTFSQGAKKIIESIPEPAHELIEGGQSEHMLTLSATADYSEYECEATSVVFRSTLMFQTRVFNFPLKNSGRIRLQYQFQFFDPQGQPVDKDAVLPFHISHMSGTIPSGEIQQICIRFHPTDVGTYAFNLVCHVKNLKREKSYFAFPVKGISLRPFCHFELESSDYISGRSSNGISAEGSMPSTVPMSIDPATRVIEIESIGIRSKSTRRFYVLNPTTINYDFQWTCESDSDEKKGTLRCLTPTGSIMAGKKFEMAFEYAPDTIDLMESFWKFRIVGHNIIIPFLVVCHSTEPNVFLDRTNVNFKSLLVGSQFKETIKIVNNESLPFSFAFSEIPAEFSSGAKPILLINPMSGAVAAHSELPITIAFMPNSEKSYNFNLSCQIKKKPSPILLNLKGEGYQIHETLQAELPTGVIYNLAAGVDENVLDFGKVQINEKVSKNVLGIFVVSLTNCVL